MEVPHADNYGPKKSEEEILESRRIAIAADRVVIDKLSTPLKKILEDLQEDIEAGTYTTIIGDDASGRIPALMLATVISDIYVTREQRPPLIRFFAGSSDLKAQEPDIIRSKISAMEEGLLETKDSVYSTDGYKGKALIVTDVIATGESVQTILSALRAIEWDADIVSIGNISDKSTQELEKQLDTKVSLGGAILPMIYSRPDLAGVEKSITEVHAQRLTNPDNERIRLGREYAKKIAHEIAMEYVESRNVD